MLYNFSYFLKLVPEGNSEDAAEKIRSALKKIDGAIIEEILPSKKTLSYPVSKCAEGLFGSIKFSAEAKEINSLTEFLNKEPNVLRFMVKKDIYRETPISYRKRKPSFSFVSPKQRPAPRTKEQIAEIDKKLEEILGT